MIWRRIVSLAAIGAVAGCSTINHTYRFDGYGTTRSAQVKRVVVGAWAPESAGVAEALTKLAADQIRMHTNYLVYGSAPLGRDWAEACGEQEGVLAARILELERQAGEVTLHLELALYRCSDGRLLWRADAEDTVDIDDEDLRELTAAYVRQLGEDAGSIVGPAFVLLKELSAALPNPRLSEEEELEKIDLGRLDTPSAALALILQ